VVIGYLMLRGEFSLHIDQFNVFSVSSGALAYGMSFYFYLLGMKYIPTSLSAILLCLTPIFGVFFSVLFISETINAQNIVGFMLILVSSVLVTREFIA
jgi:drug/metabolite transporter (DMT)-like permease